MKNRIRAWMFALMAGAALVLTACGGGGTSSAPTAPAGAGGGALALSTDGENMAFKPNTLTAKAGENVTVNFQNAASGLQHNWVLVKGNESVAEEIDQAGISAGPDKAYVPENPNIVAHTTLINPGQRGEVSFTAPAAGTYQG